MLECRTATIAILRSHRKLASLFRHPSASGHLQNGRILGVCSTSTRPFLKFQSLPVITTLASRLAADCGLLSTDLAAEIRRNEHRGSPCGHHSRASTLVGSVR
ncbi:MAG: hypothetical protein JWO71_1534 [Candidatus Acidoferrum typicum]|nr:hypothetical protein [Candidatus Acidoferrum typicum]